jgi:hypothetical protein
MITIIVINLLLGFFDNRLFFDADYIKYLRNKNSNTKVEYIIPQMKFQFFERFSKEEKKEKTSLFIMEKLPLRKNDRSQDNHNQFSTPWDEYNKKLAAKRLLGN